MENLEECSDVATQPTIVVHTFCKERHVPSTGHSYYAGTWDQLVELCALHWNTRRPGYRPEDIVQIDMPESLIGNFYSGLIELEQGHELVGTYSRRLGAPDTEEPRISYESKNGTPTIAKSATIVLYRSSALEEPELDVNDPNNWEIVSINANPTTEPSPINPWTLMHNHFGSSGGTDTNMSTETFVKSLQESFDYWKNKAMCGPSNS